MIGKKEKFQLLCPSFLHSVSTTRGQGIIRVVAVVLVVVFIIVAAVVVVVTFF